MFGQVFDQVSWGQKIQCTVLLGQENTVYSSTGAEQGNQLTTLLFVRPNLKTAYPLTTNDTAVLQLFVNDYRVILLFVFCCLKHFKVFLAVRDRRLDQIVGFQTYGGVPGEDFDP